ncbi:hypothetical protein NQ318_014528 [Aromia moschata]|uniref:Uncharacterized protein n=1 Tax=Aromia moschata TaxID=1265417 RepID=A0AAV8YNF0_9CUCU|nr:hypothetical protein NQ318_014528 [Aromia moschata]
MLTVSSVPTTGIVPQNFEIRRSVRGPGISSNDTDRVSGKAKKTRKIAEKRFAKMKKMISLSDPRIKAS